ncbi:MAG: glycoside hydrolase family 88 protein [Candidatus Helarchaeota archaeon]
MSLTFLRILNKVKEYSMTQFTKEYEQGSWGKGLLLCGLIAKYLYDQDNNALDYARKWVIQSIETQTPRGELGGGDPSQANFALIGCSLLFFAKLESKVDIFKRAIEKQANYFFEHPLNRTEQGTIYYLKNAPQVWIDTVFMICPFLIRAGTFLNMPKYVEEAIKQLFLHIKILKDPETGLYRHIWDAKEKKFYDGTLWGRGNGWMLASLVDVAEQLPDDHQEKSRLVTEIQMLAEKLILCQDEQGFWRIVLDDFSEKSKVETAGTLIITYGLSKAIRNEWIDISFYEYVQNAFDAIISCVDKEGMIRKASGPTINPKYASYDKPYPHAQGFFLITALEVRQLLQFLKERQLL